MKKMSLEKGEGWRGKKKKEKKKKKKGILIDFFVFLGPYQQHMEVPRLGVESEL